MSNKKQIGVFSGSFNPIHLGHLMLASYAREFVPLDEVWFVVSPCNPLKDCEELIAGELRLKMVEYGADGFRGIIVSDVEFFMPTPSYTIDTLDLLSARYADCEFSLIMGADNWADIHRWKEYERLRRDYRLLIYPRLGSDVIIPAEFSDNVVLMDAPVVEISSTFIRSGIRDKKNMRAFLPARVYDFISSEGLYL